jgi:hypothetical protein
MVAPGHADVQKDYQCGKGEDVRRIEIRFEDASGQLPCRVIYRPESEDDTVGTVSWRGITALESCQAQAKQVVDRLTAEGWSCTIDDQEAETAAAPVAVAALEPTTDTDPDYVVSTARLEPDPVVDPPAALLENLDIEAPSPMLAALIKGDLAKLDATLDGQLHAKILAYEDLNDDDIADALVLLTYTSPQPAYRQFLSAYLHDGEAYQLTSTRPVASSSTDTVNAAIEGIEQGVIHLTLQAYQPGDELCCPSGIRQKSFALRNLDLVEIDRNAATR